jgi:hypothetical protein
MIIVKESSDLKIQQMAYNFFTYLTEKNRKLGQNKDSKTRRAWANQYYAGMREFIQAICNYTIGYRDTMSKDQNNYNIDCKLEVYDKIIDSLENKNY